MLGRRGTAAIAALLLAAAGALTSATPVLAATGAAKASDDTPVVRIDGLVRDGASVKAVLVGDPFAGATTPVTRRWLLDGTAITGATTTLTVRAGMVGSRLVAEASATVHGAVRVERSAARTVQPGATSERALRSALTTLLPTLPGRYTVRVRELDGGRRDVSIGGSTLRYPASTSKLFLAYGVYRRIDQGRLSPSSRVRSGLTVAQCLRAMIEPSDNFCADDLRAMVGTAWLNDLLQQQGYPGTRFLAGTEKTTTASDVARLLARLARGTLLSKASTARLLRQLETQVWREAIPPALPKGTKQASKPGTKMRSTGMVQTDAAIVWGARTRYVVTVLGSHGATIPSITRIARVVQTRLQGTVVTPFVYDRRQMRTTTTAVLHRTAGGEPIAAYPAGTLVEVIDSARNWYLVRMGTRLGWVRNTGLVLRGAVV